MFSSSQLAVDRKAGEFVSDDPVGHMTKCVANIAAIAKTDISKTMKTTILLTDLDRFLDRNAEYSKSFQNTARYQGPALPKGAQVEFETVIEP